jgi:hypothetical protein
VLIVLVQDFGLQLDGLANPDYTLVPTAMAPAIPLVTSASVDNRILPIRYTVDKSSIAQKSNDNGHRVRGMSTGCVLPSPS